MLKRFLRIGLVTLALMVPSLGVAQNATISQQATGVFPINNSSVVAVVPIQYGQVRACGFPAVGSPCTNPASIFDLNGSPLSISGGNFGQITTDVTGRYSFECASGALLTIQVANSAGSPQISYPVTCPSTNLANIIGTNNTWTGTNTFNAGVTFNALVNILANLFVSGSATVPNPNKIFFFCEQSTAHCDGVTDDTTTWNAAMSQASSNGGIRVIFGVGKIVFFSGTITINHPNVDLDCEAGWSSGEQPSATTPTCELLFASGNNVTGIDTTTSPAANIATSVQIRHLYIVGQAAGVGTGNGIHLTTNAGVLEYNRITGFGNCGIDVDSSVTAANPNFARAVHNYLVSNKVDGICLNGALDGNDNVGVYEQNTLDSNGGWGINLMHAATGLDPSTNEFRSNHCISNTLGCMAINGASNILIGNYGEQSNQIFAMQSHSANTYFIHPAFGGQQITDAGVNNNGFIGNCQASVPALANTQCWFGPFQMVNLNDQSHVWTWRVGAAATGRLDLIDSITSTEWVETVPGTPNAWFFGISNVWINMGTCTAGNAGQVQLCANSADNALTLSNAGAYTHVLATGSLDAKGIQTKRVAGCATAAALNATCDTTVTWTTAFSSTNYTAVCTGDVVTSGVPIIQGIDISAAKATGSITVRTISITAAAAQFTTIDCTAQSD